MGLEVYAYIDHPWPDRRIWQSHGVFGFYFIEFLPGLLSMEKRCPELTSTVPEDGTCHTTQLHVSPGMLFLLPGFMGRNSAFLDPDDSRDV